MSSEMVLESPADSQKAIQSIFSIIPNKDVPQFQQMFYLSKSPTSMQVEVGVLGYH